MSMSKVQNNYVTLPESNAEANWECPHFGTPVGCFKVNQKKATMKLNLTELLVAPELRKKLI